MLLEYAVEPEVVAEPGSCRYVLDQMGVSCGRLIAGFPSDTEWAQMAKAAIEERELPDRTRKSLIERIIGAKRRKMSWSDRAYDYGVGWLENAVTQHAVCAFEAIVAVEQNPGQPAITAADSLDVDDSPWRVARESAVVKRAAELAAYVQRLLQNSRDVLFVDPYFDPHYPKWRPILAACLSRAMQGHGPLRRVEYHCRDDDDKPDNAEFKARCDARLPGIVPTGVDLSVFRWRQRNFGEAFHARYLLTERGGYRLDYGFDEDPTTTQDVALLDEDMWRACLRKIDPGQSPYDLVQNFVIHGVA